MIKTAQNYIDERIESEKEYIIDVAEATNKEKNVRIIFQVVKKNNEFFFLASNGCKSIRYMNIVQAKLDIQECWGKFQDFKFLI